MGSNEKIDVIDFIINVLREHEKDLDSQISRLEGILDTSLKNKGETNNVLVKGKKIRAVINNWNEFQEKSVKPEIASYNMREGKLVISAVKEDVVFVYYEEIAEVAMTIEKSEHKIIVKGVEVSKIEDHPFMFNGKLKCGLNLTPRKSEYGSADGKIVQKIVYEIDTEETRNWLSKRLNMDRDIIIYGEIEI